MGEATTHHRCALLRHTRRHAPRLTAPRTAQGLTGPAPRTPRMAYLPLLIHRMAGVRISVVVGVGVGDSVDWLLSYSSVVRFLLYLV